MIQAKIVADSISPQGHRLTTLEVVMPRYILAEFNTHRVLSKNSASSRAIPFNKMVKNVQDNPFIPYAWQRDHSGMQGNQYITNKAEIAYYEAVHETAMNLAIEQAKALNDKGNGVTKQLANRYLEPFMYHKVLVSGTEWENFFNLRCPQYGGFDANSNEVYFKSRKEAIKHLENIGSNTINLRHDDILGWLRVNKGQADIHMMFLAEAIYDAMNESTPKELKEGEWHIPYGDKLESNNEFYDFFKKNNNREWITAEQHDNALDEMICKISIARCARLSYQTLGDNPVIDYAKDLQLYDILSKSGHWSPFEHVAKVMTEEEYSIYINGKIKVNDMIEAEKVNNLGWCRNFRGFIQQRVLID